VRPQVNFGVRRIGRSVEAEIVRWRATGMALGALAGAAVSASVWSDYRAALAAGGDPQGVDFGVSTLLAVISFPWSLAVALVATPVALLKMAVTGTDGGPWVLALCFLMPAVAGAGWAWLGFWLAARLRRPHADGPSAEGMSRPSA
jgi:hypothetical protein